MTALGAVDLIEEARRLLIGLKSPLVIEFLELWPTAAPRTVAVQSAVAAIPGLRHLSEASAQAAPFSASFAGTLAAAAHSLTWRRSYSQAEVGADFWDNYGWTELVGLTGPAHCDRLACGVLLLGAHVTYPLHHHEAEEIYVPLSGTADWKVGAHPWEALPPGSVIHHPRHESHAMHTGETALLAMYLWRSDNLAQKSRLDVG
jgi:mannose-6-phosphate isomerase-like protein (cupin superfamily)